MVKPKKIVEVSSYIFLGVGAALSVLGFFLKLQAAKTQDIEERLKALEIEMAKNAVIDAERWKTTNKLLEDRRADVVKIYDRLK